LTTPAIALCANAALTVVNKAKQASNSTRKSRMVLPE
jgi:hypothetical protein